MSNRFYSKCISLKFHRILLQTIVSDRMTSKTPFSEEMGSPILLFRHQHASHIGADSYLWISVLGAVQHLSMIATLESAICYQLSIAAERRQRRTLGAIATRHRAMRHDVRNPKNPSWHIGCDMCTAQQLYIFTRVGSTAPCLQRSIYIHPGLNPCELGKYSSSCIL